VNPLDLSANNPYADSEYQQEWGIAVNDPSLQVQQPFITSTSVIPKAGVGGTDIAGPLYKWVRITPRTEASAKLDVDGDGDSKDTNPLFYDGMQQLISSGGKPVSNAAQVFTVTALAMTPYGSRRMVQYTVAPSAFASSLATFPSALILDGTGVQFKGYFSGNQAPANGAFQINGNDGAPSGTSPGIPAIGYTNSSDYANTNSGLSAAAASKNYLSPQYVPNVGLLALPPMLQTPSGLDRLVQSITQNADLVLNPPSGTAADQTSLTSMSAANPMVVVVNGDFHLSHASGTGFTGYGLLLVTGTLRYDPDVSWYGIILVIGKGVFDGSQPGTGGQINGTVLIANTRDNSNNLLSSLGPVSFNQTAGNGIQYNSQLVTSTEALMPYQVLSFREIAQTTP
jgi:hypothetical protein